MVAFVGGVQASPPAKQTMNPVASSIEPSSVRGSGGCGVLMLPAWVAAAAPALGGLASFDAFSRLSLSLAQAETSTTPPSNRLHIQYSPRMLVSFPKPIADSRSALALA